MLLDLRWSALYSWPETTPKKWAKGIVVVVVCAGIRGAKGTGTRFVCWHEGCSVPTLPLLETAPYCSGDFLLLAPAPLSNGPGSRIAARIVGNTFLLGFSHRLAHLPAKSSRAWPRPWAWEFAERTAAVSRFVCYDLTMAWQGEGHKDNELLALCHLIGVLRGSHDSGDLRRGMGIRIRTRRCDSSTTSCLPLAFQIGSGSCLVAEEGTRTEASCTCWSAVMILWEHCSCASSALNACTTSRSPRPGRTSASPSIRHVKGASDADPGALLACGSLWTHFRL